MDGTRQLEPGAAEFGYSRPSRVVAALSGLGWGVMLGASAGALDALRVVAEGALGLGGATPALAVLEARWAAEAWAWGPALGAALGGGLLGVTAGLARVRLPRAAAVGALGAVLVGAGLAQGAQPREVPGPPTAEAAPDAAPGAASPLLHIALIDGVSAEAMRSRMPALRAFADGAWRSQTAWSVSDGAGEAFAAAFTSTWPGSASAATLATLATLAHAARQRLAVVSDDREALRGGLRQGAEGLDEVVLLGPAGPWGLRGGAAALALPALAVALGAPVAPVAPIEVVEAALRRAEGSVVLHLGGPLARGSRADVRAWEAAVDEALARWAGHVPDRPRVVAVVGLRGDPSARGEGLARGRDRDEVPFLLRRSDARAQAWPWGEGPGSGGLVPGARAIDLLPTLWREVAPTGLPAVDGEDLSVHGLPARAGVPWEGRHVRLGADPCHAWYSDPARPAPLAAANGDRVVRSGPFTAVGRADVMALFDRQVDPTESVDLLAAGVAVCGSASASELATQLLKAIPDPVTTSSPGREPGAIANPIAPEGVEMSMPASMLRTPR